MIYPAKYAAAIFLSLLCGGFALAQQPKSSTPKAAASQPQKISNPLNDLLDQAQAALDKNDFEAAIPPLQKFLAEKPDVAYAHFQLAFAYTGLKRVADAKAEYERCMQLDPKMAEAPLNLGTLLLESDAAAAVAPLKKAVELLPGASRPRYLLGVALEQSGDLPESAEAYAAAARLDANDTEARTRLGGVDLKLHRAADAEKEFRLVLERQPKSVEALDGLAVSLDAQNKPEAADAYRAYLALQPGDSTARNRLLHLLITNKQYDEALAESEKLRGDASPTMEGLRLRAEILVAQNKFDDAIAVLKQAEALAPQDTSLHGWIGRLYLQKRDFPNAERELKTALQADRGNADSWKDLASTFYLGGNYAGALAAYDALDKLQTPGAGEWFIRALCYDKLDQVQPALDAYRKFLDLDQNRNPDQVWQANQRIHVLEKRAEKKK